MTRLILRGAVVALAALGSSPALAQDDRAALVAEVAELRARLEALEAKLAASPLPSPAQPATVPSPAGETASWKGAPQFASEDGWSFKPRGRLQYDVAHVSRPNGIVDPGLGFSNELRRGRLGVEGAMPGGFGYRFEVDFADNEVEFTDAFLTYRASKQLGFTLGQHFPFQSLEELTSSLSTSFMERAAFTDAFNFERRVGLSGTYSAGDLIVSAGIFTDNIADLADDDPQTGLGDENKSVGGDLRLVYAPKLAGAQLHLGGSVHVRDRGNIAGLGGTTRYARRPLVHSTNTRFVGTTALRVEGESHGGLEAAFIRGPLHGAGEIHWFRPDLFGRPEEPTFFGGYVELGYFLTGETRGYRDGRFDRTRVLRPVEDGGFGALQINIRYDHLDLADDGILGGRQFGYQASLIWIPQDHVRFLLNYGRLDHRGAIIQRADGSRDYSVDVIGARAQVDF
jgi:phosphate-selective porin OprO/OprP